MTDTELLSVFVVSYVATCELSQQVPRTDPFSLFFSYPRTGILDVRRLFNNGIDVCLGTCRYSLQQCRLWPQLNSCSILVLLAHKGEGTHHRCTRMQWLRECLGEWSPENETFKEQFWGGFWGKNIFLVLSVVLKTVNSLLLLVSWSQIQKINHTATRGSATCNWRCASFLARFCLVNVHTKII